VPELVVLVDKAGTPIGTAPKLDIHTSHTPLHLAFSCYVFNEKGQFLLTQRAHVKKVWPDVWTNSLCGHLSPGESTEDAIKRRLGYELGIRKFKDLKVVLPDYRYKTPPYNGIIENEVCPVYAVRALEDPKSNPSEVEDWRWVNWSDLDRLIAKQPEVYSYWFKDQLPKLAVEPRFQAYRRLVDAD